MGNTQSETFTPSDGFFVLEAAKNGDTDIVALFLVIIDCWSG